MNRTLYALLALAAAFGAVAPAAAQTQTAKLNNTPAEKFIIAPGGVDMRTGRYVYNETDLSIGGEGTGGLALTRTLTANVPNGHINPFASLSHNWDIMVTETQSLRPDEFNRYDLYANVHYGGRSQTFPRPMVSGAALAQVSSGIAQSLSYSGDRAVGGVVYTYTAADGTVAIFRPLGSDCGGSCAYVSQITETDGTRFSFDYASAGAGGQMRLTRVTSSRGYALILEGSGHFVNKACVVNLAKTAAGNVCPAGVPTANYTYSATGKTRLASAKGPDNAESRFTYNGVGTTTGFIKPGYESPWLTNTTHEGNDELGVVQDIVDRQDFADGQVYHYSIEGAPYVSYKPSGVAGGSYWNAFNEQTDVKFAWPVAPGTNSPGSPCRQLPCSPTNADDVYNLYVYQQTPGPVSIVDPLGNETKLDYCEPAAMALLPAAEHNRCIVFSAALKTVDPEGVVTEFKYDSGLNATEAKRYPKPGVLNPDGSVPAPIVTSAVYDRVPLSKSANKPLSMTDAKGNITRWTYAPEHGGVLTETGPAVNGVTPQKRYFYIQRYARLASSLAGPPVWLLDRISTCRTGNPSGAGCALGASDETVTSFDYGPDNWGTNLDLLGQSVAADGQTLRTCFAYDGLGRKISETSPNGTTGLSACPTTAPTAALPYTKSIRYDIDNRVTGTISPDPDGAGTLPHPAVRNSYDPAGRLIRVEEGTLAAWQPDNVAPALWPGFTVHKYVDTSYDALDRKTRESVIGIGAAGPAAAAVTEYGYDLAGRLKCTAVRMNPDHWAAPLNDKCVPGPVHGLHGSDRISKTVYDKAGRPIESWDGVGTPLARREAHYTYNRNGQNLTLTDARGFTAELKYDGFDRQSRWVFPSKTTPGVADQSDYEQYLYDANGNRTSLRKRDGSTLTFQYDALNRMSAKIVPERSGLAATHTRDVHYRYDNGGLQLTARFDAYDGEGVTNWYDGFGRPVTVLSYMFGQPRYINHQYDRDGNRILLTFTNDNGQFRFDYDGLGRMTHVIDNPALTHVDDYVMRYFYKAQGSRHAAIRGIGSAGFVTTYHRDALQRLSILVNDLPGTANDVQMVLGYNPAGQIRSYYRDNDAYAWTGGASVNRNYTVNGQNQYTSTTTATLGYDLNGNLSSDGTSNFVYDVENRLVSATGEKTAALVYDPLGRLAQTSGGAAGVTQFLYDGDELIAEYNAAGALTKRYAHGPETDEPVAVYDGPARGIANRRYMLPDERGSIVALINADGSRWATNSYDEYGVPGAGGHNGRFGYTGQTWIPELGLWYYKARFYSSRLGRFLQLDPIGYEDQINMYAYVGNDPINGRDPTGESGEKEEDGLLKRTSDSTRKAASAVSNAAAKTREGLGQARDAVLNVPGNVSRNVRDSFASILSSEKTTHVGRWMSPSESNKMIETGLVQEPNNGTGQSYVAVPASSATFAKEAPKGSVYVTYRVPTASLRPSSSGRMFIAGQNSITSRNEIRQGRPGLTMPRATFITIIKKKP